MQRWCCVSVQEYLSLYCVTSAHAQLREWSGIKTCRSQMSLDVVKWCRESNATNAHQTPHGLYISLHDRSKLESHKPELECRPHLWRQRLDQRPPTDCPGRTALALPSTHARRWLKLSARPAHERARRENSSLPVHAQSRAELR